MEEEFDKLVSATEDLEKSEFEEFFLKEAVASLRSSSAENALETAAEFDRFKKQADDFYRDFFHVLSEVLKRRYMD